MKKKYQTDLAKKHKLLGMPYGTANHRLRKSIIFHLLIKLGENTCFVCKKPIDDIDTLSIEHKIPWMPDNVPLFWDLSNIAFSHVKCNVKHESRKVGLEGQAWCAGCKVFLDRGLFHAQPKRWNGVRPLCKECHNTRNRAYKVEAKRRIG